MRFLRTSTLAAAAAIALYALPAPAQQGTPGLHFIENWDLDQDGQVTPAEAETKRADIFRMFDMDDSGTLDATEYALFDETREADMTINEQGPGRGPMRSVNEGMALVFNDVDGDGVVALDEFVDKVPDWFALVDKNADGVITVDDFGPRQG